MTLDLVGFPWPIAASTESSTIQSSSSDGQQMKIPTLVQSRYSGDNSLRGLVDSVLGKIEASISANKMVFFPEYTDHSVTHIEQVLQTCVSLVTPDAIGQLTGKDLAVLALATGLHDFGMYLSKDGFESLISINSIWKGVPGLDQAPWSELWETFFAEASRFDGRKLLSLFGNNYTPVRPIPTPGEEWSEFDFLLVGEFLRRYHPRLAHEIAIHGMPAKNGQSIALYVHNQSSDEIMELAGLVARSHGMPLRLSFDYLEARYEQRVTPRGVHMPFLMVLLRVADYFQIQQTRAPTERTEVAKLTSPISQMEWSLHQSIKDIHNTNDPEAFEVIAEPNDVASFLKLKNWLTGLQKELDLSWAGLGEVYGRQHDNDKNKLGIRVRRIKSNVDNEEKFAKSVNYVPEKLSFQTANADLLKLLVGPLYGNDPSIGIRELIQNAVDAVREMDDLISRGTLVNERERWDPDADVQLIVECNEADLPISISIVDRGVGMSISVLRDYFLRAGASFRKSEAWKSAHTDETGSSRVLRTGRFGVGALAAFLLGDEIEVTTRHYSSANDRGLNLKAKLDTDAIEVLYTEAPIGTKITIKLGTLAQSQISKFRDFPSRFRLPTGEWVIDFDNRFGHYFLNSPKLTRTILPLSMNATVKNYLPIDGSKENRPWRCFDAKDFGRVYWTYEDSWPILSSNGIVVIKPSTYSSRARDSLGVEKSERTVRSKLSFIRPNLSVFDRDGRLPVNLARNALVETSLAFNDQLILDIFDDAVANALVRCPNYCDGHWALGDHPSISHSSYHSESYWSFSDIGVFPTFCLFQMKKLADVHIRIISDFHPHVQKSEFKVPKGTIVTFRNNWDIGGESIRNKGLLRAVTEETMYNGLYLDNSVEHVTLVPTRKIDLVKTLAPGTHMKKVVASYTPCADLPNWSYRGKQNSTEYQNSRNFINLNQDTLKDRFVYVQAVRLATDEQDDIYIPSLRDRWISLVGENYLPFDKIEREKVVAKASSLIGDKIRICREELGFEQESRKKREEEVLIDGQGAELGS